MPATESTWRDTGRMHRIFAISGVVMTIATVWMFYKDHARPWKVIQPQVVNVDLKMNAWRREQFDTTDALLTHARLSDELSAAKAAPVSPELISKFQQHMQEDAKDRQISVATDWITDAATNLEPLAAEASQRRAAATQARQTADAKPADKDLHLAAEKAEADALAAERRAAGQRDLLLARLKTIVAEAKSREDIALGERKFKSANIDAAKANLDIAIRDNLSADELARREEAVQKLVGIPGDNNSKSFTSLNLEYQRLSAHRKALDGLVKQMTAATDKAQKNNDDSMAALERLETQYKQQAETWFTNPMTTPYPFILGKKWLTLPIIDAFNSPRRIDNLWSEGLEHTYGSFGTVRRFDRCTTCHQSLAKSTPGAPTDPAYVGEQVVNVTVTPPTGEQLPKPRLDDQGNPMHLTTEDWLGVRLADKGLLINDDVTVSLVLPRSPAARAEIVTGQADETLQPGKELRTQVARFTGEHASPDAFPLAPGLVVGDVIEGINGSLLQGGDRGPRRVAALLTTLAQEGKSFTLRVRRGLPNPFISHPRLDLYVSDSSPHKLQTFACTVCHDGQGSATEFKFASHSPNTERQADQWASKYGWFDNHHWIFPMNPKRFAESSCLKCHHEVVELEATERYPEAPAPKVVHGYQLIRKYGCYGCHEINGFDGPVRRIGPDLRMEPNFFAAAQALLPLLPARQAHYQAEIARLTEAAAPLDAELKKLADQRPPLEEQKGKIDPNAADKDAQTKAIDDQLAKLAEQEKAVQEKLAALHRGLSAAKAHLDLIAESARLASALAVRPELDDSRRRLLSILDEDVRIATENKDKPLAQQEWTTFDAKIQSMAGWFKDQEAPGDQRKPGPSLRYVAAKMDRTFLYDWLKDPTRFRANTRMPKFFSLWNHLKNAEGEMIDPHAPKLEPIEIRGTLEFLLAQSNAQWPAKAGAPTAQPTEQSVEQLVQLYQPLLRETGIDAWTDEEKVARGKMQFQTRGCLACHSHKDFPEVAQFRKPDDIVQGPDLSAVGSKFSADRNPQGPDWLYSWIKEPTRYHTRTVMPNLFLGPEKDPGADAANPADDKWFDPADDIASYLLASKSDWQPAPEAASASQPLDENHRAALNQLTSEYLNEAFYKAAADEYLNLGIPPELESELKGAEKDLIVDPAKKPADRNQWEAEWELQKLRYIGRKSIAKYGCFGCHDIPGFEDAKPIGTGLADWGRKDPARLAFEHITHYVGGHGHGANHAGGEHAAAGHANHSAGKVDTETAETEEFYLHALNAGNRIGFIQQKLKEPRSFDFEKTENKRFNERLRMPQFPFSLDEREAIITFVLGLVADPPREKYIFTPTARKDALITGRQVLEKYNCGGCHILGLEKWRVSYPPGTFGPQSPQGAPLAVFPFLRPQANPKDLRMQAVPDHRNLLHSTLVGLPKLSPRDGLPEVFDPENSSLTDEDEYLPSELRLAIDLYQPAIIDGDKYVPGISPLKASAHQLESRQPAWGGVLARYLVPVVTQLEKQANPNASGAEAYAWLPPPLIGEGNKVQSGWLHDFLLEPYPIRPSTFLRMPKFNMTSDEATQLANYFAAVDNANFPHELSSQRLESELAARAREYGRALDQGGVSAPDGQTWSKQPVDALIQRRFDDAMQIIVDGNYCVKCHKVGDFVPAGRDRALAPQLTDVYRRMRPDFVRHWIAKPSSILPYTSMPENIKYEPGKPFDGGVTQNLYHGTSTEQVDGLVDLLMNYDTFARRGRRIAEMVKPATVPAEGAPPAEGTTPPAATGASGE